MGPYRSSATLILACGKKDALRVAMLRRTGRASFMPDAYVFPGGAVEPEVDGDPEWMKLVPVVPAPGPAPRPPLFEGGERVELMLRIAAIRETFEELGVLLAESPIPAPPEWRDAVQKDPRAFLAGCKEYGVAPAAHTLSEWSNWLTPNGILPKRFDTAFFVAGLPLERTGMGEDGTEVVDMRLVSPVDALLQAQRGEILLHPPQFVELGRLARYQTADDLLTYAVKRAPQGMRRWCPQIFDTPTSRISAFPGDALFNEGADVDAPPTVLTEHPTTPPLNRNVWEKTAGGDFTVMRYHTTLEEMDPGTGMKPP
eukprot:Sspe_Gene.97687::Locus_71242_Transcript_2_3_Confidence_0.400_Length_1043::g.97687::m.97687/K13355/NUDT19; nucleoside diphosphate-linked moiety X motif 19, mitochondrial